MGEKESSVGGSDCVVSDATARDSILLTHAHTFVYYFISFGPLVAVCDCSAALI